MYSDISSRSFDMGIKNSIATLAKSLPEFSKTEMLLLLLLSLSLKPSENLWSHSNLNIDIIVVKTWKKHDVYGHWSSLLTWLDLKSMKRLSDISEWFYKGIPIEE